MVSLSSTTFSQQTTFFSIHAVALEIQRTQERVGVLGLISWAYLLRASVIALSTAFEQGQRRAARVYRITMHPWRAAPRIVSSDTNLAIIPHNHAEAEALVAVKKKASDFFHRQFSPSKLPRRGMKKNGKSCLKHLPTENK